MKKVLAAILCLILPLGLFAGCKRDGEFGPVEEGATVVILYAQDFEEWNNDHLKTMGREFNSILDDGVQLEWRFFQDEAYTDALKVARENHAAPDLYMVSYGNLATDMQNGYAAPLDDLLPAAAYDDLKDNVKSMVTYGDNYYAYPTLLEPSTIFFYRKDIFEKAGITAAPKTWEELYTACAKIKGGADPVTGESYDGVLKRGQYTLGMPTGLALGWGTWGMQYNTTGGLAVDETWRNILVDSEGYRDLAQFFHTVYGNGWVPAGSVSPSGLYNDIIEGLCQDKLAMTFAGSWSVAEIMNTYPDLADNIGIAPIPTKSGEEGKITATNGGWTYAISSESRHKEAAAKVIEWMFASDPARTARFFEAAHYSKSPVNKSVQDYIDAKDDIAREDFMTVINDVASKAKPEPLFPFDISNAVAQLFEYMAVNCDKNFNGIIEAQINKCVSDIATVLSRPDFPTNPQLGA